MLPYPKNTNPLPHPSKTSPKNHFLRPFIKPIPLSQANKENQATPNINKPTTPLNKKQAVFTGNPRKFSLTPQETNDLLSPGHYPQSSHKIPTFKSPQRKTPSYFNVKGDSSRQTTFFNSPENNKKSTYNYAINDKNSNNNNNSLANESHLKETKNKENIFDRMKVFSNDIMQSAKSFINHKLNSLSAREKCACETGLKSEETCQKAFKWLYKRYKKNDLVYLKNLYEKLQNNLLVEEVTRSQISRDILRTYPNCDLFKEGHDGTKILERVLLTFACYDPQIGYVQGMNYIAGFFLYHAEEFIAFWLLALIFELFELRDIYLPSIFLYLFL